MRKISTGLLFFVTLVFISCQKEIDWGLGGGNTANQLLVKISSKTGTDSAVISYSYDAQKRLIRETVIGVSTGTSLDNDLVINRNAAGIITRTIQKSPAFVAAGVDSVVTRFNYNPASSQYTSGVFSITIAGFTITDSAVYTYDAGGKIASDIHYLGTGILPPIQILKDQYTYSADGLNLVSIVQLASLTPGAPLSPLSTQTFNFDNKINPLIIKNEGVLLARTGLYNANNGSKLALDNTVDATVNFTMDYTFKYNTANKPDSSFGTRTPGGTVTASKYFYQ